MKKLFVMLLAITTIFSITALAAGVVLPDPGHYFGRSYDGYMIEFDKYPKEEFDAYVKLLTEQYGMQITEEGGMGADEYVFMEKPGTQDTEVFVSCFESEYECGMEIIVDDGITLSELDVFIPRPNGDEWSHVATENGTIITNPSIFMGYEVPLIDIEDFTHQDPPHMNYEFDHTSTEDLARYIEEINASPYFELVEVETHKRADRLKYHFRYTGSEPSISISDRNLSIIVPNPKNGTSTFYIYEYPGFTINTAKNDPDPEPPFKTCSFCNGDGKCNSCDGKGYQQFYNATQGWYQEDCSCSFGKCPYCGGLRHD